jgi:1,2-diacylglycerol 3-alpha-glucosyltransferase
MKILMLTFRPFPFKKPFADSIRFVNLNKILKSQGNQVTIIAKNDHLKFGQKEINSQKVYFLPALNLPFLGEIFLMLFSPFWLKKIISKEQPDLVFINSLIFFRLPKSTKNRSFKIQFDVMGLEHNESRMRSFSFRKLLASLQKMTEVKLLNGADFITTVNLAHQEKINQLTKKPVFVLRDAIDPKIFSKTQESQNKKNISFLFVGSLANHRLDDLFLVLPSIFKNLENFYFNIIGDGKDFDYYKNEAKAISPRIKMVGYVAQEKLGPYLEEADICYSDDWSKIGFPAKVFEYMASGKAVVVQDTPAVEEVISNGANGFVYSDAKELESIIIKLANDFQLRNKIGHQALIDIENKHTWDKRADELKEIYQQVFSLK